LRTHAIPERLRGVFTTRRYTNSRLPYLYTKDFVFNLKFSGDIEADESRFGHCRKNNLGARKGCRIWIVGILEHCSKKMTLYPIECRPEEVLLRLIDKHVKKGSHIFTDVCATYGKLNESGYEHFTVIHSLADFLTPHCTVVLQQQCDNATLIRLIYTYIHTYISSVATCKYINRQTGQEVVCHINNVEEAWAHAKKYFRSINGCSWSTFEGHLAEIMWRNHVSCNSDNEYKEFFALLKQYYPLDEACKMGNCANFYDT